VLRIVNEARIGSRYLGPLMKFSSPKNVQDIIDLAENLKLKYRNALKEEAKISSKHTIKFPGIELIQESINKLKGENHSSENITDAIKLLEEAVEELWS
jgi:hypothetical protein